MFDRPASKTTGLKLLLSLGSMLFARRYPASRALIVLPLVAAALDVYQAKQRRDQVQRLNGRPVGGLLDKIR